MVSVSYVEKNLKKLSREERLFLDRNVDKLKSKIQTLSDDNTDFSRIFNNDSIKYDVYNNGFCAVKFNGHRISIRVLYKFIESSEEIEVHLVHIKKTKGSEYIQIFRKYSDTH